LIYATLYVHPYSGRPFSYILLRGWEREADVEGRLVDVVVLVASSSGGVSASPRVGSTGLAYPADFDLTKNITAR
jgi:hypothetical protein